MFTAVSITDLKLYFFLGETVKHEKGGRRGRDNRHSRHIKTQPRRRGSASSAARRNTDSRAAPCAVGLHSEVDAATVCKV